MGAVYWAEGPVVAGAAAAEARLQLLVRHLMSHSFYTALPYVAKVFSLLLVPLLTFIFFFLPVLLLSLH